VRVLSQADPRLGEVIAASAPFCLRPQPFQSPFQALVEAIVYQQLNGKAAATILGRLCALYRPRRFPRPSDLLETPPAVLRAAGISARKGEALLDLSRKTLDGGVPTLAALKSMDDEAIIERLDPIRGIGRWTVEMLLIFRLGRPDVLPADDYGVRKGFARAFRTRGLPSPVEVLRRGERWRPYRTVASWYLWRAAEMPPVRTV
jgi:DNA-3-methyladenine glycosylase II